MTAPIDTNPFFTTGEPKEKENNTLNEIADNKEKNFKNKIWENKKFEWLKNLPAKKKGHIIENIYKEYMAKKGHNITNKTSNDHDCIVNERKKEIKMSCMSETNSFTFFQIRQFQNYDDLVFVYIKPDDIKIIEINKEAFMNYIVKYPKEVIWAGGKEKKERLGWNIRENDLFHWIVKENKTLPKEAEIL